VFVPSGAAGDAFAGEVGARLAGTEPSVLLNERLRDALDTATARLAAEPGVHALGDAPPFEGEGFRHQPEAFEAPAAAVAAGSPLLEEHFGPVVLLLRYGDADELLGALARIEGQLTGTRSRRAEADAALLARLTDVARGARRARDLRRLPDRRGRHLRDAPRRPLPGDHLLAAHLRRHDRDAPLAAAGGVAERAAGGAPARAAGREPARHLAAGGRDPDDGAAHHVSADSHETPPPPLLDALGGPLGMAESVVPSAAFVTAYAVTGQETRPALIVAVVLGVVFAVARIVRGQTPQFAVAGLGGLALSAYVVSKTGRAEDFFVPGLLANAAYALAYAISIAVRWPLLGVIVNAATSRGMDWRADPEQLRAYTRRELDLGGALLAPAGRPAAALPRRRGGRPRRGAGGDGHPAVRGRGVAVLARAEAHAGARASPPALTRAAVDPAGAVSLQPRVRASAVAATMRAACFAWR
jgi:hypothetical protein